MIKNSSKKNILTELFKTCKKRNNFIFNNKEVRNISRKYNFGNPCDVTKVDKTTLFPDIMIDEDYCIVHLGRGEHKFVKGINTFFHLFEPIKERNISEWDYKKSILNEYDTSESNALSIATNQRIIHKFLYRDITANPKIYYPHRTFANIEYYIGNTHIVANKLQMEVDLTFENFAQVTVFEGKNGDHKNFSIYQLFHPYKYYYNLKQKDKLPIKQINCCYILINRKNKKQEHTTLSLYLYAFEDPYKISSIKFLKNHKYILIGE